MLKNQLPAKRGLSRPIDFDGVLFSAEAQAMIAVKEEPSLTAQAPFRVEDS